MNKSDYFFAASELIFQQGKWVIYKKTNNSHSVKCYKENELECK